MGELRTKKRGKGWEYSFECAKVDGKRKSISKGGFRTKAEALAAGAKAKAEYDNAGIVFRPSEMSLSDYLDFWLKSFVKTNCTDNTYDAYASAIRLHIKPALGHYKLSALNPAAIQQWLDSLKNDKRLSEQSMANYRGILSGSLRYAVYPCQYLRVNPCTFTKVPKVEVDLQHKKRIEHICVGQEWEDICNHFNATCYYLPLMICYYTGLRIGECFGLDLMRDVDFKNHTLSIHRQLQKDLDKKWYYKNPKYDSFRTIKIGSTLESLLKSEITVMKMNRLRYGEFYTKTYVDQNSYLHWLPADQNAPEGYTEVWPLVKENGEMLNNESMKYCVRIIKKQLGYDDFHAHSLRHTHGTLLVENGAPLKAVMERLGHKDLKTTIERYVTNTDKLQEQAVEAFETATTKIVYR